MKIIEDLENGIVIEGTVEYFGFDGYYETDTPDKPIEVYVTLDEDGLRAHCESNGILYADELGGDIIDFLEDYSEYSVEELIFLEKYLEENE